MIPDVIYLFHHLLDMFPLLFENGLDAFPLVGAEAEAGLLRAGPFLHLPLLVILLGGAGTSGAWPESSADADLVTQLDLMLDWRRRRPVSKEAGLQRICLCHASCRNQEGGSHA